MNKVALWIACLMAAGLLAGCFSTHAISSKDGLAKLADFRAERPQRHAPPSKLNASISVRIDSPSSLGCLLEKTTEPEQRELGSLTCPWVPLLAGLEQEQLKDMSKRFGGKVGLYMQDVDSAFKRLLKYHLSRRFRTVTVKTGPGSSYSPDIVIQPSLSLFQGRTRFAYKRTYVTLTAKYPYGSDIVAQGEGVEDMSAGHMAWGLPVMLITFPIGPSIVAPIFAGIEKRTLAASMIKAMDDAADDLADKMASELHARHTRRSSWQASLSDRGSWLESSVRGR